MGLSLTYLSYILTLTSQKKNSSNKNQPATNSNNLFNLSTEIHYSSGIRNTNATQNISAKQISNTSINIFKIQTAEREDRLNNSLLNDDDSLENNQS